MDSYSVLMSVYAKVNPHELKLSISSMLAQTVKPEQFILIWDGPVSDELKNVVSGFEKANPGVFTVIQLPENHGLAYALNEGIKASRNELIARMDSDDYSLSHRCERQLLEFEKDKELALLGGHTQHFKDSIDHPAEIYGKQPVSEDAIVECIRRNSAFSHPTVMFRKSSVLACGGYDAQLRRSQDHDLFSKMIAEGYKCRNLDEILVLFRADDKMMLRNRSKESCNARIIIQKRILKRKQCTVGDYLYIRAAVVAMQLLPEKLYLMIYSMLKEKS